jgi:predicted nuclease of predicted toxin-antitoxin system
LALALYFDQNVSWRVADGLRMRGVDVLTAYEDNTHLWPDPALLDRATQWGRVLFTHDQDFLVEGARRQQNGIPFVGIIYAHSERVPIGILVQDLELMAKAMDLDDTVNRVLFLPL